MLVIRKEEKGIESEMTDMVGKHGASASTEALGEDDGLRRLKVNGRLHHHENTTIAKGKKRRGSVEIFIILIDQREGKKMNE